MPPLKLKNWQTDEGVLPYPVAMILDCFVKRVCDNPMAEQDPLRYLPQGYQEKQAQVIAESKKDISDPTVLESLMQEARDLSFGVGHFPAFTQPQFSSFSTTQNPIDGQRKPSDLGLLREPNFWTPQQMLALLLGLMPLLSIKHLVNGPTFSERSFSTVACFICSKIGDYDLAKSRLSIPEFEVVESWLREEFIKLDLWVAFPIEVLELIAHLGEKQHALCWWQSMNPHQRESFSIGIASSQL